MRYYIQTHGRFSKWNNTPLHPTPPHPPSLNLRTPPLESNFRDTLSYDPWQTCWKVLRWVAGPSGSEWGSLCVGPHALAGQVFSLEVVRRRSRPDRSLSTPCLNAHRRPHPRIPGAVRRMDEGRTEEEEEEETDPRPSHCRPHNLDRENTPVQAGIPLVPPQLLDSRDCRDTRAVHPGPWIQTGVKGREGTSRGRSAAAAWARQGPSASTAHAASGSPQG